ncbi:GSCFA domain-containing protein [Urechidicola sp. KH5]
MNFRTQIPLYKERNQIDYNSEVLLLGSCFSENIGSKLEYFKFNTSLNPFGIMFHPKAIESYVTNVANERTYSEADIFDLNEQWHCFEAHSTLSSINKNLLLNNLNTGIRTGFSSINSASHIIITLGTAWVYRHIASDTVVANCHKVPQKKFLKELMTVDEIEASLQNIICLIKNINKDVHIVFTLSPIRHIKDGVEENSVSKAYLRSAIAQITDKRNQVYYYPSFEIMMDDLRDYRFYKEDLIHPSAMAIDYIWDHFSQSWISENAQPTMQQVAEIQRGLNHKPFNPNSEAHQTFLKNLENKIATLEEINIRF